MPTAPATADTEHVDNGSSDTAFSKGVQRHGSMAYIVDVGRDTGGRDGSSGSRDPATPLSKCLPARLRRKSVQYRKEREEQDEDHDAEVYTYFN